MRMKAVIVDDEALARRRIRQLLEEEHDVEVVAECEDADTALRAIRQHRPSLLFLDVQLRGESGFRVFEKVGLELMPATVMVTGYEEYAVQAFESNAVDYVLKPVSGDRLHKAVEKARRKAAEHLLRDPERLYTVLRMVETRGGEVAEEGSETRPLEWVTVKAGGVVRPIAATAIERLEAAANYVKVYVNGDYHVVRSTLSAFEEQLDPGTFVRIHRSTIINKTAIESFEALPGGDFLVNLRSGAKVKLSRNFREQLEESLGYGI